MNKAFGLKNKIQLSNFLISLIVIGMNLILFVPLTIEIIATSGGTWGIGLMLLPFTIIANLFCATGISGLLKKHNQKRRFIVLNSLGLLYCFFLVYVFYIH